MVLFVSDYEKLFQLRGSAYDSAMQAFPNARQEEFLQVIAAAKLKPGMRVLDVPAGGGYLRGFLPPGCHWVGHEPCSAFTNHGSVAGQDADLLPLPFAANTFDAVISLAGIHHMEDKSAFFSECHRVLKPEGVLALSDVAEGSATARFLDGFVGAHNSTGHSGLYLNAATGYRLARVGFAVDVCSTNQFHWRFASRGDLGTFCRGLFDVIGASPDTVANAVANELGVDLLPGGICAMRWSLLTITARKLASSEGP
jgi:SAM-dependent methyltransferase